MKLGLFILLCESIVTTVNALVLSQWMHFGWAVMIAVPVSQFIVFALLAEAKEGGQ